MNLILLHVVIQFFQQLFFNDTMLSPIGSYVIVGILSYVVVVAQLLNHVQLFATP